VHERFLESVVWLTNIIPAFPVAGNDISPTRAGHEPDLALAALAWPEHTALRACDSCVGVHPEGSLQRMDWRPETANRCSTVSSQRAKTERHPGGPKAPQQAVNTSVSLPKQRTPNNQNEKGLAT